MPVNRDILHCKCRLHTLATTTSTSRRYFKDLRRCFDQWPAQRAAAARRALLRHGSRRSHAGRISRGTKREVAQPYSALNSSILIKNHSKSNKSSKFTLTRDRGSGHHTLSHKSSILSLLIFSNMKNVIRYH